jgi:hypothetical protein
MLVKAVKISQNVAIISLLVDFAYFLTGFVKFDLQYAFCFCTNQFFLLLRVYLSTDIKKFSNYFTLEQFFQILSNVKNLTLDL